MLLPTIVTNASTTPTLRCRKAKPRDGIGMWRLARHVAPSVSPYSLVAVLRQLAETSVVAERDGEIVGFVVARRHPRSIEVLDGGLSPDLERPNEVLVEMLVSLLELPSCSEVAYVDVAPSCHHDVRRVLLSLCALPLAKCKPAAPAFNGGSVTAVSTV